MDTETRNHFAQLASPAALAAADALAAELPPALVAPFEALLWTVDEGAAAHGRAEQARVDTLVRAHLATGAWYDLLLDHCGGWGRTCCEQEGQPEQRLRGEPPA